MIDVCAVLHKCSIERFRNRIYINIGSKGVISATRRVVVVVVVAAAGRLHHL